MKKLKFLIIDLMRQILQKDVLNQSAIVAFNAFFSAFSMLFLATTIIGFFSEEYKLYENLIVVTSKYMPPEIIRIIADNAYAVLPDESYTAVILSLVFALFMGTNVFHILISILNSINGIKETRSFVKVRLLSLFFLILFIIFTVIAAALLFKWSFICKSVLCSFVWLAVAVFIISFAVSYFIKKGLNLPFRLPEIFPGGLFYAVSFIIINKMLQSIFIIISGSNATYGTLSAIMFILTWFQLNSFLLIISSMIIVIIKSRKVVNVQAG
ncbi:MAG: hypothetical protein A2Y40_03020 [Candidatus Margulisbacteria bacterium GWF2_35_9]|nr:MAG: hypothetical protein A2Y40_03020 [Candidatus Margulisbacteria bacterium GWF2_35_9]